MAEPEAEGTTKDRLLESAAEVFAEKGYHGAAVGDIVEQSRTSKGAFYFYFPSKQGIFLTLVDLLADRLIGQVEDAIGRRRGAVARVDAALSAVIETVLRHRTLARILLIEAVGIGPAFEAKRRAIYRRFAGVIERYLREAVADGGLRGVDPAVTSRAWVGAINEVVAQWIADDGAQRAEEVVAGLRSVLLRSIGIERVGS